MAKNQYLALNIQKLSGQCNKLLCCLKYEEDHYEATRKQMPKVGKEVITPDGNGTVIELNILKETVRVRLPKGDSYEQKDFPMQDVKRVNPPQKWNKQEEKEEIPEEPEEENVNEAEEEFSAEDME